MPTRDYSIGNLYPGDIAIYQKGEYQPWFFTLKERIKYDPWKYTRKIHILGQEETLEAGGDLLTPTKIPSYLPTFFVGSRQGCVRIQAQKIGHGQSVIHRGPLGMG